MGAESFLKCDHDFFLLLVENSVLSKVRQVLRFPLNLPDSSSTPSLPLPLYFVVVVK